MNPTQPKEPTTEAKLLRLKGVMSRTGIKRSTIYKGMKEGTFPKSVKLGRKSVAWHAEEISNWIKGRPRAI